MTERMYPWDLKVSVVGGSSYTFPLAAENLTGRGRSTGEVGSFQTGRSMTRHQTPVRVQVPRSNMVQGSRPGEWICYWDNFNQGWSDRWQDRPDRIGVIQGGHFLETEPTGDARARGIVTNTPKAQVKLSEDDDFDDYAEVPTRFLAYDGLFIVGSRIVDFNTAASTAPTVETMSSNGSDITSFQGEIIVATNTTTIHRRVGLSTWSDHTLAFSPKYFQVLEDKLWAVTNGGLLYVCNEDPENSASWSLDGLPVGGGTTTNLLEWEGRLVVSTVSGLYVGDVETGLFYRVTPRILRNGWNGQWSTVWPGMGVVYPCSAGLLLWNGVSVSNIGNKHSQSYRLWDTADAEVADLPDPVALVAHGPWLFAARRYLPQLSGDSSTVGTRFEVGRARGPMDTTADQVIWTPFTDLNPDQGWWRGALGVMQAGNAANFGDGKLVLAWAGMPKTYDPVPPTTGAAVQLRTIPLPGVSDNYLGWDMTGEETGLVRVVLPFHDAGLPFTDKALVEYGWEAVGLDDDNTISVYIFDDTNVIAHQSTGMTDEIGSVTNFPSVVTSKKFSPAIVLSPDSNEILGLKRFYMRLVELTEHADLWQVEVWCADGLPDVYGGRSAATMLEEIAGLAGQPLTVTNGFTGEVIRCRLEETHQERIAFQEGSHQEGTLVRLAFMKIMDNYVA